MNEIAYTRLVAMASEPEAQEKSVCYLESQISTFLKKRERVLICFETAPGGFGNLVQKAVLRCGGIPVIPEDLRWKTLMREAFFQRCSAIVGTPLLVLGLAKLAKRMQTPLYARNVLLAGYPSAGWMIDGIRKGLDCDIYGCYEPGAGNVIAGFSCDGNGSVHLRSDAYGAEIVKESGEPAAPGELGEVVIFPADMPQVRFFSGDFARLNPASCPCGCSGPILYDFDTVRGVDPVLSLLGAELHQWTSVLDCRLSRSGYGLELEIVTFPGEKLPKLPSCAKLVVRNWNPEEDVPFRHMFVLKNRLFSKVDS